MIKQRLQIHVIPIMASLLAISLFPQENWTNRVRIDGIERVDSIIVHSQSSNVFGETYNDITGRYESFLDPTDKLKAVEKLTDAAYSSISYSKVYSLPFKGEAKELTFGQKGRKLVFEIPPIKHITLI